MSEYPTNRTTGLLVVCFAIIACLVFSGIAVALLDTGPTLSARGGCFVNTGSGCNTTISQTLTPAPDLLATPGFLGALVVILVLGLGFLFLSGPRKQG
jgi:hypothetical protein